MGEAQLVGGWARDGAWCMDVRRQDAHYTQCMTGAVVADQRHNENEQPHLYSGQLFLGAELVVPFHVIDQLLSLFLHLLKGHKRKGQGFVLEECIRNALEFSSV